ncbi:MAG: FAD:protein FMN transferase [Clostridiales bacterium]|nr:FAD:protein FMN transferase [Clostridiales bacterium]
MLLDLCSCSASLKRYTRVITGYFDTATTVTAYDVSDEAFEEHVEEFESLLREYDSLYSIYDDAEGTNNLKTVNDNAGIAPVEVDQRIIDLLLWGKQCHSITGGKVNICFGAVLKIWHEYREEDANRLPSYDELCEASAHTNIEDLIIDEASSTVFLQDPLMRLDVGAIAKGFAGKSICDYASSNLWHDAAISFGGNVITFGNKKADGHSRWNILVENPDLLSDEEFLTLEAADNSIVTSGDYQRFYIVDGQKYCHIIDPETLYPASEFSSVTVICDDSAMADLLSTWLFIEDQETGMEIVDGMDGVEAIWTDSGYNVTMSSGSSYYVR